MNKRFEALTRAVKASVSTRVAANRALPVGPAHLSPSLSGASPASAKVRAHKVERELEPRRWHPGNGNGPAEGGIAVTAARRHQTGLRNVRPARAPAESAGYSVRTAPSPSLKQALASLFAKFHR